MRKAHHLSLMTREKPPPPWFLKPPFPPSGVKTRRRRRWNTTSCRRQPRRAASNHPPRPCLHPMRNRPRTRLAWINGPLERRTNRCQFKGSLRQWSPANRVLPWNAKLPSPASPPGRTGLSFPVELQSLRSQSCRGRTKKPRPNRLQLPTRTTPPPAPRRTLRPNGATTTCRPPRRRLAGNPPIAPPAATSAPSRHDFGIRVITRSTCLFVCLVSRIRG